MNRQGIYCLTLFAVSSLLAVYPEEPLLSQQASPIELHGDVHVRENTEWRDRHYLIHGNIIFHEGGMLLVENATVELKCTYSRQYLYLWEGGKLITRNAVIGGAQKDDGTIGQTAINLTHGEWDATDTTIRYCYGIYFGYNPEHLGKLRATRLIAGPHPDSIIMGGNADVIVRDSRYNISLAVYATKEAECLLDLPHNKPFDQVYDARNLPGVNYRLELTNCTVPMWWVFFHNVSNDGPPVTITLRDCPAFIPSILANDLRGTFHLPSPWPGDATHGTLSVGNLTLKTLDKPVHTWCWGVYLSGEKTDVTLRGPTNICEMMVWDGKATLVGDEGTFNAKTTATTIDVGREKIRTKSTDTGDTLSWKPKAELTLRNASIGRFPPGSPVKGQITAKGDSVVRVEDSECSDLLLITKDRGKIAMTNVTRRGTFELIEQGGPITFNGKEN